MNRNWFRNLGVYFQENGPSLVATSYSTTLLPPLCLENFHAIGFPEKCLWEVFPRISTKVSCSILLWLHVIVGHFCRLVFYSFDHQNRFCNFLLVFFVADEIQASFRQFGPLVVDWPHKAECKSYFPPKGRFRAPSTFSSFTLMRRVSQWIETHRAAVWAVKVRQGFGCFAL